MKNSNTKQTEEDVFILFLSEMNRIDKESQKTEDSEHEAWEVKKSDEVEFIDFMKLINYTE